MKRILIVIALCVMTFWSSHTLRAGDFGIVAGAGFTSIKNISPEVATGYHAGLTYKFNLPLGFAIQPSLLYNVKASHVDEVLDGASRFDFKMGYLELPVSLQWGPDLLLFRPFLDMSPYVGYALNTDFVNQWADLNRLEYGIGLGGGLEIWKIQVACRYNWNFGPLFNASGNAAAASEMVAKGVRFDDANFGGVSLSVALLF